MPFMNSKRRPFLFLALVVLLFSCQTVDLYEKNVAIPGHAWKSTYKPQFRFLIKDTATNYHIYVVLRHNEKYNYNNIWINLSTRIPGDTMVRKQQYELPLANNEGWIGKESAMDDLYEHRIRITPKTPQEEGISMKPGEYEFTIEQTMREEPLENVMNVGIRIEKTVKL